jgi:excisionase family DNA binding protein
MSSDASFASQLRFYTLPEVARLLRVSKRTIQRLAQSGKFIKPARFGARTLFPVVAVDEFMQRLEAESEVSS